MVGWEMLLHELKGRDEHTNHTAWQRIHSVREVFLWCSRDKLIYLSLMNTFCPTLTRCHTKIHHYTHIRNITSHHSPFLHMSFTKVYYCCQMQSWSFKMRDKFSCGLLSVVGRVNIFIGNDTAILHTRRVMNFRPVLENGKSKRAGVWFYFGHNCVEFSWVLYWFWVKLIENQCSEMRVLAPITFHKIASYCQSWVIY